MREPWHAKDRYPNDTTLDGRTAAELACTRGIPEPRFSILMRTTRALQASKYGSYTGAPGRIRTCDARLRSPHQASSIADGTCLQVPNLLACIGW
jgi:hypothetical protein